MTAIEKYMTQTIELMRRTLDEQKDNMEKAARAIVEAVRQGGMIYTFGTGHGHLLALEVFYRAGGMAKICPILDEKLMLHISAAGSTREERREDVAEELLKKYPVKAGDVVIISSNYGRNAAPVMMARAARERGAFTVALTSLKHSSSVSSRNSLNLRLFEAADLVLDNGGVPGDASVLFSDGSCVGPTSTVIGAAMLQAIVCRVKEISLEEGVDAEFFVSSNIDGGDEINDRLIEKYQSAIPGLM